MPNPGKKYDFKINQLIELPKDAQFSWIETNVPDYDVCYGDGYLGAFYPSEPDLSDFLMIQKTMVYLA